MESVKRQHRRAILFNLGDSERERWEGERGKELASECVLKSGRSFLISPFSLLGGRSSGKTSPMEWCDKLRRVWNGIALRLGIRKRGLLKLRHDVRACEYEDVHVMWRMLKGNESETVPYFSRKSTNKSFWNYFHWAGCTPYLKRTF